MAPLFQRGRAADFARLAGTFMEATARHLDDTLRIRLRGTWHMSGALPRFADVVGAGASSGASSGASFEASSEASSEVDARATDGTWDAVDRIAFDADDLTGWDSSLVAFLDEATRACQEHDVAMDTSALPAELVQLIELSQAVPDASVGERSGAPGLLERLGTRTLDLLDGAVAFATFTGRVAIGAARVATGRGRMRWRDFWVVAQRSSVSALPIVTLISFLVGLILAFLGAVVLQRFGADYYVSYLVSYGVLRELGALMTAIIMAGRTGAAFAAEIGSMKISEEIDALKTLGISPVDFLVMPRLIAVFAALPLLTLYANAVAIGGGWAVSVSMLDITTPQFFTGLVTPVTLADAVLGIVKAAVYGAIIGLSGCLRGLQTGSGASAVGDAATSAVVTGITLIVAANALLDWLAVLLDV